MEIPWVLSIGTPFDEYRHKTLYRPGRGRAQLATCPENISQFHRLHDGFDLRHPPHDLSSDRAHMLEKRQICLWDNVIICKLGDTPYAWCLLIMASKIHHRHGIRMFTDISVLQRINTDHNVMLLFHITLQTEYEPPMYILRTDIHLCLGRHKSQCNFVTNDKSTAQHGGVIHDQAKHLATTCARFLTFLRTSDLMRKISMYGAITYLVAQIRTNSRRLSGPWCSTACAHATLPTARADQSSAQPTRAAHSACVRGSSLTAAFTLNGS